MWLYNCVCNIYIIGDDCPGCFICGVPLTGNHVDFSAGLKRTVSRKVCDSVGIYVRSQHLPASVLAVSLS
jgi:hypothetical protein